MDTMQAESSLRNAYKCHTTRQVPKLQAEGGRTGTTYENIQSSRANQPAPPAPLTGAMDDRCRASARTDHERSDAMIIGVKNHRDMAISELKFVAKNFVLA
jgi:hypothetical protein